MDTIQSRTASADLQRTTIYGTDAKQVKYVKIFVFIDLFSLKFFF